MYSEKCPLAHLPKLTVNNLYHFETKNLPGPFKYACGMFYDNQSTTLFVKLRTLYISMFVLVIVVYPSCPL